MVGFIWVLLVKSHVLDKHTHGFVWKYKVPQNLVDQLITIFPYLHSHNMGIPPFLAPAAMVPEAKDQGHQPLTDRATHLAVAAA